MVEAMEKIRDSCIAHGVTPGTQTRNLPLAKFWSAKTLAAGVLLMLLQSTAPVLILMFWNKPAAKAAFAGEAAT